MSALKTLAVAVGASAVEVVALLLIITATSAVDSLFDPNRTLDRSHGVRVAGAVATFVLWTVPGGAAAIIAIRLSARRLGASFLGAVFIVGAFNGLVLYVLLAYTTVVNECIWNVSFPLGGSGECRFR